MKIFTNLQNSISSLILDEYTLKYIILYVVKSNLMFTSMFTNTLLCLSLTSLIVEFKLGHELDLFTKQMNINKPFPS